MAAELWLVLVLLVKCNCCSEGRNGCIENNTDTGERTRLLDRVLVGMGGLLLVIVQAACVITGITIWACHSRKARRAALHISTGVEPRCPHYCCCRCCCCYCYPTAESPMSCTPLNQPVQSQYLPSINEYQPKPNTPTETTGQFISKLTRDSNSKEAEKFSVQPRSKYNALQGNNSHASDEETEGETAVHDIHLEPQEMDNKVQIILQHKAKTEPQNVPHPVDKTSEKLSPSVSNRPRLPTPAVDKCDRWESSGRGMLSSGRGMLSSGRGVLSSTPVAQVRTSQWYDNLKWFQQSQASRRQSKRIDEESFHYANDGLFNK